MTDDGPNDPSECSKQEYCMCGLRVYVYGLKELADSTNVSCLWLLHPRLQDQSFMDPVARSAVAAWNDSNAKGSAAERPGLIAVSFDQRNHGSRLIDPLANEDWRSGNERHALDMFGIIQGTVHDMSQLIDHVSSYLFPTASRKIGQHLVCGISLGGHAAWQAIFNVPGIEAGVSVIGTPDLRRLLEDRARLSKRESLDGDSEHGSEDFPSGLLKSFDVYDPASRIFAGESGPNENGELSHVQTSEGKARLKKRLGETIMNKTFVHLTGADDKLVPDRCSRPFIQWLLKHAANDNDAYENGFRLEVTSYNGVGHQFTADMANAVDRFVVESVAGFWNVNVRQIAKI